MEAKCKFCGQTLNIVFTSPPRFVTHRDTAGAVCEGMVESAFDSTEGEDRDRLDCEMRARQTTGQGITVANRKKPPGRARINREPPRLTEELPPEPQPEEPKDFWWQD